jgi:hypothetical protein
MYRPVFALLTAALVFTGCGGGSSAKEQATKVAVAYRKATLLDDYETQWKLRPKTGNYAKFANATAYADDARRYAQEHNAPPSAWPPDTKFTVDAAVKQTIDQSDYYRVTVRASAPGEMSDNVADLFIGKYGGKWLVGGGPVAPGSPATVEPTR